MAPKTLLAILAHPDDEVGAAGSILAQRARGDRVVLLFLTRGEATAAFGDLPDDEVAERRMELAREAAGILDVEHRFLDMPDGGVVATPESARRVAHVIADLRPDGILTWGDAWVKGMRHPDHQATGKIARDAVTHARVAKLVAPEEPYRGFCPVFTLRGAHSRLPEVVVDVEAQLEGIFRLAAFYREHIGFGERSWLEGRLRQAGQRHGLSHAETFDAWESKAGPTRTLLPAEASEAPSHPNREDAGQD